LQNICRRCQQKVQWRFQMGKYKTKKAGTAGRCNHCSLQRVKMAYRSVCDACAKEKNLCPGCNRDPQLCELMERAREAAKANGDGDEASDEGEDEEDLSE